MAHPIVNHVPVTSTGSLKVRVMFAFSATEVAPAAGLVTEMVGATSAVLKLNTRSPDGWSRKPSWSWISAATTVAVQSSPTAKLTVGSTVNVSGPPVVVTAWLPLESQLTVNAPGLAATGSLKVTLRLLFVATPVAPSPGVVDATAGTAST